MKKKQNGSILITALVSVFILAILAFSILAACLAGAQSTGHRTASQMAFDVADAGFQHAFQSLCENSSYSGQSNVAFGPGKFTVTVTPSSYPECVEVVSVGTVIGGASIPAVRTIKGRISMSDLASLLNYAVISKGSISFSGSSNVTSSPTSRIGNVFSDTSVSMSGGTLVNGTLGSVGTITTTGAGTATGGMEQFQPYVALPQVNTALLLSEAQANGTESGSIRVSNKTQALSGVINGDVTVTGGGQIVLNGVVYVNGDVTLSGNSYAGSGCLVVTGKLVISGNSGLATTDTSGLAIVDLSSSSSAVTFSGGASVGGFVYVPNGMTTLSGGAQVIGGVATNGVNFSGGVNVTRNTLQTLPAGLASPTVAYWQDQTGSL